MTTTTDFNCVDATSLHDFVTQSHVGLMLSYLASLIGFLVFLLVSLQLKL